MGRSSTIVFIASLTRVGVTVLVSGCSQLPKTFGDPCSGDADCGVGLHCSLRARVCTLNCDPYEDPRWPSPPPNVFATGVLFSRSGRYHPR